MSWLSVQQIAQMIGGKAHGENVNVSAVSIDSRTIGMNQLFIALKGLRYDGHQYINSAYSNGASAVIASSPLDIALPWIEVGDTTTALTRFASEWRQKLRTVIVGLTGSNGKTTTKDMLAEIVGLCKKTLATKGNLNNHIGVPLTLLRLRESDECAIVEMGANHVNEIKALCDIAKPNVGIVLNAGSAHLEGFGSLAKVAEGKGEIYQSLGEKDTAIFNCDDTYYAYWKKLFKGKNALSFGFCEQADVSADDSSDGVFNLRVLNEQRRCRTRFMGRHNVINAMAAACTAVALKIDIDTIVAGLEQARPAHGRLTELSGKKGMTIIDDSYNANPSSLRAALAVLRGYSQRRWMAIGDMAELGEQATASHKDIADLAKAVGVEKLLTIGDCAQLASANFGSAGRHFESFAEMSAYIKEQASSDICLLVKGSRSAGMDKLVDMLVKEE